MRSFARGLVEENDVSDLPDLHATAAGLKAFCTNWGGDMIEECRRCCGGQGASLSSGVAQLLVDFNAIQPLAEGDKIILALQTARFLVRAAQIVQSKSSGSLSSAVAYLAEDVPSPKFSRELLRNVGNLVQVFKWRARQSVFRAAREFNAKLQSGQPFDAAWNNCALPLVNAAENHSVFTILETFAEGVSKVEDVAVKRVLERLAIHFALVQVREHGVDWIGYLNLEQVDHVNEVIMQLLSEIRPDAVSLVDAFAIPDRVLHSALGRYDGNVYEALYDFAKNNPLNKEEYIQDLFHSHLKKVLDVDYLQKTKSQQRVQSFVPSKL